MEDWSIVIRKYMVKDLRLSGDELIAFAIIAQCYDGENTCRLTDDEFGRILDCNEAEAFDVIENLMTKNLITTVGKDGRALMPNYEEVDRLRFLGEVSFNG